MGPLSKQKSTKFQKKKIVTNLACKETGLGAVSKKLLNLLRKSRMRNHSTEVLLILRSTPAHGGLKKGVAIIHWGKNPKSFR